MGLGARFGQVGKSKRRKEHSQWHRWVASIRRGDLVAGRKSMLKRSKSIHIRKGMGLGVRFCRVAAGGRGGLGVAGKRRFSVFAGSRAGRVCNFSQRAAVTSPVERRAYSTDLARLFERKNGYALRCVSGIFVGVGVGMAWATLPGDNVAALEEEKEENENEKFHHDWEKMIFRVQQEIVDGLSKLDGKEFRVDNWVRENNNGLGRSCVLQDGNVFEKAGVVVSVVTGKLPPAAVKQMRSRGKALGEGDPPFYACGISLVVHPKNPMAPTVHLNYRYFEIVDPASGETIWWFGGGEDLSPSYLFEDDAKEFHTSLKDACDKHDDSYYPKYKEWCDKYFYNKHREESRGIGGIFFDDLEARPAKASPELDDRNAIMQFSTSCVEAFLPTYLEIMKRRMNMPFTEAEKEWQQIRRGRYVEFNLVYDRGTKFGLNTPKNARIESVLVSLPLTARWEYMHEPATDSKEGIILDVFRNPREWAVDTRVLRNASFDDLLKELTRRAKLQDEAEGRKEKN